MNNMNFVFYREKESKMIFEMLSVLVSLFLLFYSLFIEWFCCFILRAPFFVG